MLCDIQLVVSKKFAFLEGFIGLDDIKRTGKKGCMNEENKNQA